MNQRNTLAVQFDIPKASMQVDSDIGGKEFPITGIGIDITQNGMNGKFHCSKFGKNLGSANIAAMEYRTHAGLAESMGGFCRCGHIAVRVG